MSAIVGALISGGHVPATPAAEDGRRRQLHLTGAGRDLIEAVRRRKTDWVRDRIKSQLDETEQAALAPAIELQKGLLGMAPGQDAARIVGNAGGLPIASDAVVVLFAVAPALWERRHASPFLDVRMLASNGALQRTYLARC